MSIESDVADFYRLLLTKGESEETACIAAFGLCRELMRGDEDSAVRIAVARAIASVRIEGASANDNTNTREEDSRSSNKFPSGR